MPLDVRPPYGPDKGRDHRKEPLMRRTLVLSKETLSELTPADLTAVVGAANTNLDTSCLTRITTEITQFTEDLTTKVTHEACGG